MVLHRILREGDPSFREELLVHRRRRKFIQIAEFRDESSQLGNQKGLIISVVDLVILDFFSYSLLYVKQLWIVLHGFKCMLRFLKNE